MTVNWVEKLGFEIQEGEKTHSVMKTYERL